MENREIEFTLTANTQQLEEGFSEVIKRIDLARSDMTTLNSIIDSCNGKQLQELGKDLQDSISDNIETVKVLEKELLKLNDVSSFENITRIQDDIKIARNELSDLTKQLIVATKSGESPDKIKELKADIEGTKKAIEEMQKEVRSQVLNIQNNIPEMKANIEETIGVIDKLKKMASQVSIAQGTQEVANMGDGVKNLETNFQNLASNLRDGTINMTTFNALLAVAENKDLSTLGYNLKEGLDVAETKVEDLQVKLLEALNTGVNADGINDIINQINEATREADNFKKALSQVNQVANNSGGFIAGMFSKIQGAVASVKEEAGHLAKRFKRIAISSVVFSALGVIRSGLSDACKLSDSASNKFTAIGNIFTGVLLPVVEAFANAIRKVIVWVAGLVKYVTGFDMLAKGIQATNKNIANIGKNAKKSGKQVKDGLLGGLDEIENIDSKSSSGGSSGGGVDMSAQVGALGELESMMAEMSALDFSWAEPLRIVFEFIRDNAEIIGALILALVVAWTTYSVIMTVVNAVMYACPITWIVAAIAALIAIIVLCIVYWDDIKKAVSDFVTAVWDWISGLCDAIGEWFTNLWEGIKSVWNTVIDFFVGIFQGAWDGIKAIWNGVIGFFSSIWEGIKAIFNGVINFYKNIFTGAWNGVKTIWSGAGKFFTGIWDGIKNAFSTVGSWFKNIFTNAYNGVVNVFSKITGFFRGIWDSIKEIFSKVGQTIGSAITDTVRTAVNFVLSTAVKIINGFISAINIAIGIINCIPGVNIDKLKKLEVPSFDVGTDYVPEDMIAMVHKGERITPKKYNNDNWTGKEVDMTETNDLLQNLIDVVSSKNLTISSDAVGRASVDYILTESRRRGESII